MTSWGRTRVDATGLRQGNQPKSCRGFHSGVGDTHIKDTLVKLIFSDFNYASDSISLLFGKLIISVKNASSK